MKKNAFFVLLLAVLATGGLYVSQTNQVPFTEEQVELASSGSPGEGYFNEDDCGYLMGQSTRYPVMGANYNYVNADDVSPDRDQACADLTGNFIQSWMALTGDSTVILHSSKLEGTDTEYTLDLVGASYGVSIDYTETDGTYSWSGYAKITGGDFDTDSTLNPWVWFDWSCIADSGDGVSEAANCGGGINNKSYRVETNADGTVEGYAWNDSLGFIPFRDMTMEMPPLQIAMFVDVYAGEDTAVTPQNVSLDTAPMSDFAQYWRVRFQWMDLATGTYLTEADFNNLSIDINELGNVYLNQVENGKSPSAIEITPYNYSLGCLSETDPYCSLTEDGYWSANWFIYSGSPTSNMLGYEDPADGDDAIENYLDRDGCRWVYEDQWRFVDGTGGQTPCSGVLTDKADYFYLRENDRNMIGIEFIKMDFMFSSTRETSVTVNGGSLSLTSDLMGDHYTFEPSHNGDLDGDGALDALVLSFKPRIQPVKYVAFYDGDEYTQISSDYTRFSTPNDPSTPFTAMDLQTGYVVRSISTEYRERWGISNGSAGEKPRFDVFNQFDVENLASDPVASQDRYLVLDSISDADDRPDCSHTEITMAASSYPVDTTFYTHYNLSYGQRSPECTNYLYTTITAAPTNAVQDPTAEQWVCDYVTMLNLNDEVASCYYTGYLPIVDRHDDPEDMLVLGAINSVLNDESVLTNEEQISILGTTETIKLRNKMYAQVVRYIMGQTAGSGTLGSAMTPSSGNIISLMNDRLLFAQGDVTVEGSAAFADKTLVVVGGDVYIDGNITGGRLGVIAFRDNGAGGNVYVAPDVTDLYANFFLDGAFYSYGGTSTVTTGTPAWANDQVRVEVLRNQLYLNGSLVARNTVNGVADSNGDGIYDLGDGTTARGSELIEMDDGTEQSGFAVAREHDLNVLRQYRLCWPIDPATGLPDESDPSAREDCGEASLSSYRDENGDPVYNSFILEYAPATDLVIFTAENSLF